MTSHERARSTDDHGIAFRVVPWAILTAVLALQLLGAILVWRFWDRHEPIGYHAGLPVIFGSFGLGLVSTIVGLVIVDRRHRNLTGWLLVGYGVGFTLTTLGIVIGAIGIPRGLEPLSSTLAWLAGSALQPTLGAQIAALMLVYPVGRLPSPRWRPVVVLIVLSSGLRALEIAFIGDRIYYLPAVAAPVTLDGPIGSLVALSASLGLGMWGLVAAVLLAAASQVLRYRSADEVERLQIRWFAVSSAVLSLAVVNTVRIFITVDPAVDAQSEWVVFLVVATLHPVAIGLAVTRYRLYDIDRILNRALVYGALMAILAGLFAASVAVSQKILIAVTGESSDAVLVLTTLIVTTLYTPLRKRLEGLAERHLRFRSTRFGSYAEALHQTLDLLDPDEVADRLLDEAMRALDAPAGRVDLWGDDATGTPPRLPAGGLVIAIEGASGPVGRLWLADRRRGEPYRSEEVTAASEVARLAGRAVELTGRVGRPSRRSAADRTARLADQRVVRRSRHGSRPRIAMAPTGRVAAEPS